MPQLFGSTGADTFTGGIDSDTVMADAGNDSVTGGDGADALVGGDGSDTLYGGDGDDVLIGGNALMPFFSGPVPGLPTIYPPSSGQIIERLDRGAEVDNLVGGDGNDQLYAGYGDNVSGGSSRWGGDFLAISFRGAPTGVTFDFGLDTQTIGGGVISNIGSLYYVEGSAFSDNINARNSYVGFTTITGGAGDDTITGNDLSEALSGEAGNDLINGTADIYYSGFVDGGDGNDTLSATRLDVYGGNGNDVITGGDYVYGESGDDVISGGGHVFGGAGADSISASGYVFAGAGNDAIVMTSYATNYVMGGDGDDRITAAAGAFGTPFPIAGDSGADTLIGSSGGDVLYSDGVNADRTAWNDRGLEHDSISAGAGDDTLAAGWGDAIDGGAGTDSLRYSLAGLTAGVTFSTGWVNPGMTIVGGGLIQNVEALVYLLGTQYADNLTVMTQSVRMTVDAGFGDDTIGSDSSSITLFGSYGDDRFYSGAAADIFDGGEGVDTVDYNNWTTGVNVNLATGQGAAGDSLISVESVVGTGFNDTLSGDAGNNSLFGLTGIDTLSYASAAAGVRVGLIAGTYATLGAGTDVIAGFENLIGSAFNDTLSGDAGNNVLDGGAGSDTIFAGAGDDTIADGLGSNYLRGEDGNDVLSGGAEFDDIQGNMGNDTEHGGGSRDWVVGGKDNDVLYGDDGDDVINGNLGSDSCEGGTGGDTVRGGQGDDSIQGQAGDDWLSGDLGSDTLTGGAGADAFHAFAGVGLDRITDFNRAEGDRVLLDPGTTYTLSQSGADTVIDISGGGQMILVGVQLSSLGAGWITAG